MTEEEKRQHRVCFTGHRPEKLTRFKWVIKTRIKREIRKAINDGFTVFISGMAQGIDIWAAEIVIKLRDGGHPIKLICACPYDGFEKNWSQEWKDKYHTILSKADHTVYVCQHYGRGCFQIRNEWMVDHSARVIAVFNGEKSGTKNTIDYANKVGVPIRYIKA